MCAIVLVCCKWKTHKAVKSFTLKGLCGSSISMSKEISDIRWRVSGSIVYYSDSLGGTYAPLVGPGNTQKCRGVDVGWEKICTKKLNSEKVWRREKGFEALVYYN